MNFKEWLLSEMQYLRVESIPSLGGKPFFYFNDKPVVGIDFRFEWYGYNRLNSLADDKIVGWIARIPDSITIYNGSLSMPEKAYIRKYGEYIVVNKRYRGFRGEPLVNIDNNWRKAAYDQLAIEVEKRVAKENGNKIASKHIIQDQVKEELKNINLSDLYVHLPEIKRSNKEIGKSQSLTYYSNEKDQEFPWIDFALLELSAGGGGIPIEGNTIDLFEKTMVKARKQNTLAAIA